MEFGSIALLSLAIAGLLVVPFVANSVTSYAIRNYDEGISAFFNESPDNFTATDAAKYPGTTHESLGPDMFSYSTETAFGKLHILSGAGILRMELHSPGSETLVLINNSDMTETWELKKPGMDIRVEKSPGSVVERYSIPSGWCEKRMESGSITENCSGLVTEIDNDWSDAKKELESNVGKMKVVADSIEVLNPDSSQWEYS